MTRQNYRVQAARQRLAPGIVRLRLRGLPEDVEAVASILAKTGIEILERSEPYGRGADGLHLYMLVRLAGE